MLDNITIYNGLMERVIQTLTANRIAIKEIKCVNEEKNDTTITLTFKAIGVDSKVCTALATASEKDYTYSIDFRGIDQ